MILAVSWLFTSCETDMQKAQKDYDATQVIPKVLGINGPQLALQTFSYTYSPSYFRAGSTWEWSVTGATIVSVSSDTHRATVSFPTIPSGGKAQLSVVETTAGGAVSDPKVIDIQVDPFCPLALSGFVGSWLGTDGMDLVDYFFDSEVVISNPASTTVKVTGLNYGWITNVWGETVIAGGTIDMTIENDGTVVIPDQYCFTTLYDGDSYIYRIKGSGTWGNCGATPTLNIAYVIYYESDGYTLPADWTDGEFSEFYANLTLDEGKGSVINTVTSHTGKYKFPPKPRR